MEDQNTRVLSVMKERDFYHAKVNELKEYVRKLEYDNAELVKRDTQLSARLKEVSAKVPYRNKRYNNNNGQNYRGH